MTRAIVRRLCLAGACACLLWANAGHSTGSAASPRRPPGGPPELPDYQCPGDGGGGGGPPAHAPGGDESGPGLNGRPSGAGMRRGKRAPDGGGLLLPAAGSAAGAGELLETDRADVTVTLLWYAVSYFAVEVLFRITRDLSAGWELSMDYPATQLTLRVANASLQRVAPNAGGTITVLVGRYPAMDDGRTNAVGYDPREYPAAARFQMLGRRYGRGRLALGPANVTLRIADPQNDNASQLFRMPDAALGVSPANSSDSTAVANWLRRGGGGWGGGGWGGGGGAGGGAGAGENPALPSAPGADPAAPEAAAPVGGSGSGGGDSRRRSFSLGLAVGAGVGAAALVLAAAAWYGRRNSRAARAGGESGLLRDAGGWGGGKEAPLPEAAGADRAGSDSPADEDEEGGRRRRGAQPPPGESEIEETNMRNMDKWFEV